MNVNTALLLVARVELRAVAHSGASRLAAAAVSAESTITEQRRH